jgi:hypothetical protein
VFGGVLKKSGRFTMFICVSTSVVIAIIVSVCLTTFFRWKKWHHLGNLFLGIAILLIAYSFADTSYYYYEKDRRERIEKFKSAFEKMPIHTDISNGSTDYIRVSFDKNVLIQYSSENYRSVGNDRNSSADLNRGNCFTVASEEPVTMKYIRPPDMCQNYDSCPSVILSGKDITFSDKIIVSVKEK